MAPTDDDANRSASRTRRQVLAATGAAGTAVLAGCLGGGSSSSPTESGASDGGAGGDGMATTEAAGGESMGTAESGMATSGSVPAWQTTELSTVRGEETFTVAGLDGPVVVQSFAVWCPKCQRQSEQLASLDESVTRVGLNTDPNEEAPKVQRHAEENGFDWRFAVAPTEMTQSLIDEFGTTVTNAPSTPVIVVCESGDTTFMSGSVNPASELASAADSC